MQNIQNTIARIEQQKGRQLTVREKLFITHHEKAHAAAKIVSDIVDARESMTDAEFVAAWAAPRAAVVAPQELIAALKCSDCGYDEDEES